MRKLAQELVGSLHRSMRSRKLIWMGGILLGVVSVRLFINVFVKPLWTEFERKCLVCNERNISIVLLPCRHVVLCEECFNALPGKICPICREELADSTPVALYFAQ